MSEAEIPALCDACLGPNPYVKMMRQVNGAPCKVCTRPFTVFRWTADKTSTNGGRARKTGVCMTCARAKNCCQLCMLDLTYGISLQIRDAAMAMAGEHNAHGGLPSSTHAETRAIIADKQQEKFATTDQKLLEPAYTDLTKALLRQLASKMATKPAPKEDGRVSKTTSWPVDVQKLVQKLPFQVPMLPPQDGTAFFVYGIEDRLSQHLIQDFFELNFGKLASIQISHIGKCGYISFASRESAQRCAHSELIQKPRADGPGLFVLQNVPMRIAWGKLRDLGSSNAQHAKLGQVVTKVMKQIAAKDKASKASVEGKKAISQAPSLSAPQGKMVYKTASANYEG